jgi:hypothetical protein
MEITYCLLHNQIILSCFVVEITVIRVVVLKSNSNFSKPNP